MQPAVQQRTSGPRAARSRHTDPSDSYVRVLEVAAPVPFGHHGEEQAGENPSIMLHGISIAESCREGKDAAEKGMFCSHALQQGERWAVLRFLSVRKTEEDDGRVSPEEGRRRGDDRPGMRLTDGRRFFCRSG